jgi:hypothetical protein
MLVTLASSVKTWLNFSALLNFYVPFRSSVLSYLNNLAEAELKTSSARNMSGMLIFSVNNADITRLITFDKCLVPSQAPVFLISE